MHLHTRLLWHLLLATPCTVRGLDVNVDDNGSLKTAAGLVARQLLKLYNGTQPGSSVGLFGDPYYWWESGMTWSGLIDYQAYTADDQYEGIVQQALVSQVGPSQDFMPPNQTKTEGNEDQAMWALAAMNAAEKNFPQPPSSPSWLDLAKNVFDTQAARWDDSTCDGGLRFQIFSFNSGYDYKSTAAQATFFLLAARLALYTKNETYADWANKAWDWTTQTELITKDFKVFDGTRVSDKCNTINKLQWSYTAAAFTYGSAVMFNYTSGDSKWQDRTDSLASSMSTFWPSKTSDKGVLVEVACEPPGTCNTDQIAFKGLAAQWLGQTTQLAPSTADTLLTGLGPSGVAAGKSCSGGENNTVCGFEWTGGKWDGSSGLGQELNAMNIFLANIAAKGSPSRIPGSASATNGTQSSSETKSPTSTSPSPTSLGIRIISTHLLLACSLGMIVAAAL